MSFVASATRLATSSRWLIGDCGDLGRRGGQIVEEVTDDKALPKQERKDKQVESASKKSSRAKLLKLADKTSNLRTIASSPAASCSVKRRLEYIEWAQNVDDGQTFLGKR